jgi:predicted TIM-barrel fold metal-dependent hydrolase
MTRATIRRMRKAIVFPLLLAAAFACAQNGANTTIPPVIDIHVHAFDSLPNVGPVCPFPAQFMASDAKAGNEHQLGWAHQECSPALEPGKNQDEYMRAAIAEWDRLNVTAVVMGEPEFVKKWLEAAPGRVIPGTSFDGGGFAKSYVPMERLRQSFTQGGFKVMGEVGLQYQGISPSDPSVDAYFALAEELDIPVGIHMGTGGGARANIALPKFRGSMGDPLLLEDVLARHPKLRIWIMHAGYPMIDNLLTLLQANSHVYVDVSGLIWSYPLIEVNRYIRRIVEAGFEDRVMFGTDQMYWPKLMATSIGVIQNADYLTPEKKRDILYKNAARFLRLDTVDTKQQGSK